MTVQIRAQTLLVQKVRNQTDTATEHKQTVEHAHLEIVFCFFGAESAAVAEQVDKADCDAAVDVEDQAVLFAGRYDLDGFGIVEQGRVGEVCVHKFLDERYAQIRVVARLDLVADTGD